MDYFAHGFWSYIIFHRIKTPIYAVLFGILPDTISWVPYFFYRLIFGEFGAPVIEEIPNWVWTMYGVSHSIIICAIVFLAVYLILKKLPIYMLAWPLHIFIDIPTHRADFLPTPFLWPISNYRFDGISWGDGTFMIMNYALIIGCLIWIVWNKSNAQKNRKIMQKKNSKKKINKKK